MKQIYEISHAEFIEYMDTLAEMIDDYQKKNGRINYLVGIPRGGLPVAVYLSHRLGIKIASIEDVSSRISTDSNILVCDEIVDSGMTLGRTKEKFKGYKGNVKYASATMKSNAEEVPDFCVRTFKKGLWLKFPWETNDGGQIRDADKE